MSRDSRDRMSPNELKQSFCVGSRSSWNPTDAPKICNDGWLDFKPPEADSLSRFFEFGMDLPLDLEILSPEAIARVNQQWQAHDTDNGI